MSADVELRSLWDQEARVILAELIAHYERQEAEGLLLGDCAGEVPPIGEADWACEDCGWKWPLPGDVPTGAECDSCGGDLGRR